MTENEKQIVEQVAGLTISMADMTFGLVGKMVTVGAMTQQQGKELVSFFVAHNRDLAQRNKQFPGMAKTFSEIARRLDEQAQRLP